MDNKSPLKQQRQERIQELLDNNQIRNDGEKWVNEHGIVGERDPERLWKMEQSRHHYFFPSFIRRVLWSGLLFGIVFGIYRSEETWAISIQQYIAQSLNREMDFQAVESWYVSHFGEAPAIIPIFTESQNNPQKVIASQAWLVPMHGLVTTSFLVDQKGIEISPYEDSNAISQVKSVATGRILEVLKESQSGVKLAIQHTGGLVSVYGHLDSTLKVNDWVEAGDSLGWLTNEPRQTLYFSLRQGDVYLDPLEVMSFD
ncbi:M23 family metallopeptidase [Paenibacillus crassostreae]|uniref:M23ase beta-sheet core domain-containing protein n=1 Tax=Paenibacillus crassostreae TaxID=1763538 RepID=A0A167EEP4_9BACL|nr:M23 family metallopeptidase [Paenibacillus crassostreae]AOZ91905.1 hypothetical protein LPB68_06520 [Paenibacillus crassostreae]OAB75464.1 hypothetical protein PNBC_08875 [Paenibacillus crassostreae]